ncbi:phage holin family protein [Sodalis praecaptivus]|uniref:phage holin family protein n=1 Tax=Sodalis praecaptivus TaxID=1239307 RepID=UPI00280ADB42|nr:phage holin family protein [Sodalis praecaptivus]
MEGGSNEPASDASRECLYLRGGLPEADDLSPGEAEFNRFMAFVAWLLNVAMGAVVIRVVMGGYVYIDWSELMINAVLCSMLYHARGNVGHLFKITK